MNDMGKVCHEAGLCETPPIVEKTQLIEGSTVSDIKVTLDPNGAYPTWIRNGLLDALNAAVRQIAVCTPGSHTDTCPGVSAMSYCPQTVTKYVNCVVSTLTRLTSSILLLFRRRTHVLTRSGRSQSIGASTFKPRTPPMRRHHLLNLTSRWSLWTTRFARKHLKVWLPLRKRLTVLLVAFSPFSRLLASRVESAWMVESRGDKKLPNAAWCMSGLLRVFSSFVRVVYFYTVA
jgi:hypothetical protein